MNKEFVTYDIAVKLKKLRKCWVYSTYEEALEIGLVEALKLIKNEKN